MMMIKHYQLIRLMIDTGRNNYIQLNQSYNPTETIEKLYCSVPSLWTGRLPNDCDSLGEADIWFERLFRHSTIINFDIFKEQLLLDIISISPQTTIFENMPKSNLQDYINIPVYLNGSDVITDTLTSYRPNYNISVQKRNYKLQNNTTYMFVDRVKVGDNNDPDVDLNNIIVKDNCILACLGCYSYTGSHYETVLRNGENWQYYDSTIENLQNDSVVQNNNITVPNRSNNFIRRYWSMALYKVIKRNVNVIAFDLDGVLHKDVRSANTEGFRNGYAYDNIFNATIEFIVNNIDNDEMLFHIISHNPDCNNKTAGLLTMGGIDFENKEKIQYHCLETDPTNKLTNKVYKLIQLSVNIFVEDSPAIINSCIRANRINALHENMVLYYAIPELELYIRIEKDNEQMMKLQPDTNNLNNLSEHEILGRFVENYDSTKDGLSVTAQIFI